MFKRKKATSKDNLGTELQPDPKETLGRYIRRLRLIRAINLPDLARATIRFDAPVSQIELSKIELGFVARPSIEQLTSLAKCLDIPPQWLIEKSEMSGMAAKQAVQDDLQEGTLQVTLDPDEQEMILAMIEQVLRRRRAEKSRKQE